MANKWFSGAAKIKFCAFFIILLWAVVYGLPAAYAEGIDLGACNLYPTVKVEEKYETNVFQLPNDITNDFLTTTTPELSLKFKCSGKNIFNIDYKYEIKNYDKLIAGNRQNSKFDTVLELYGAEYFLKAKEDFKKNSVVTSYSAIFDDYSVNDAMVTLGRELDKTSFEFRYENLIYDYQTIDSPNDYIEHIFDFVGYYKFLPKAKALIEYNFSKFKYGNNNTRDADANEVLTGLKGELTVKLSGTVKIGYQDRKYKNNQDWRQPVTYVNVLYDISKKTSLSVTMRRTVFESAYTVQNYYEEDILSCLISQRLTAKTAASLNVSYANDIYPSAALTDTTKRRDDIWDAKIAVDTNTRRWLVLGASYEFAKRGSNLPGNGYTDNITSIYVRAMY